MPGSALRVSQAAVKLLREFYGPFCGSWLSSRLAVSGSHFLVVVRLRPSFPCYMLAYGLSQLLKTDFVLCYEALLVIHSMEVASFRPAGTYL